ncbi:MAG: hypothetical protein K9J17_14970 [Flavobacteriales bacterium]|nr:hypothetical protein [Flavobacteriales bacterium]
MNKLSPYFKQLLVLLLFYTFHTTSEAQTRVSSQSEEPSLDVIWTSLLDYAGISESELLSEFPSFPIRGKQVTGIGTWLQKNRNESENLLALLEKHKITPSRIQLGLGERALRYTDVVPYWSNAFGAYGSEAEIRKQLIHMPDPKDYCEVGAYSADMKKFESWRDEFGFGPGANERIVIEKAPDPQSLYDEDIYPCIGKYYVAIEKWIWEYPKEYHTMMAACNCSDVNWVDMPVMPDSLRQPYLTPKERIASAIPVGFDPGSDDHASTETITIVTSNNPIDVLSKVNSKLIRSDLETTLMSSGDQAFGDALVEIVANEGEFWFIYHSSLIWYFEHDRRLFDLLSPIETKHGYDLSGMLIRGNASITTVDDNELIAKFKLISQ